MKLLISIFICSILWISINAFDCYDCQNCEVPFNSQTDTTTCVNANNQCTKLTVTLGTVYSYVLKQCGPCSNETFAFGVTYMRVDCCTGPLCNGTNGLTISKISLFITVFLCLLFYKK